MSVPNSKMMKAKNVLMIVLSGLSCAFIMLGLNNNCFAQPLTGKCGDGICDDFEKAHPDVCPADCQSVRETFNTEEGAKEISPQSEDSPFGFHPAMPFEIAKEMGVKWTRGAECPYLFWKIVDPQKKGSPAYFKWKGMFPRPDGVETFVDFDKLFLAKKAGLEVLQNIDVQSPELESSHSKSGSWLPTNEKAYKAFVREAVKRYSFINYWQIGNEPNLKEMFLDYTKFHQITYQEIKRANPDAKVLIAGLAGNMDAFSINDNSYESVLKELKGKYMDIFDIHFYGDAKGGTLVPKEENGNKPSFLGYRDFKTVYTYFRGLLDKNGFSRVPIWVTEMGTFSGTIQNTATQTEAEQARDLLKRYVYPLSLGVKKIFWAFSIFEGFGEWDNDFFDHTGLVYSNRDGIHKIGEKKLGYYTYKLMTEKLEGSDWSKVETVKEDDSKHIYVYKFIKGGRKIFVAWWDYFLDNLYPSQRERQFVLTGINSAKVEITEAIPHFSSGKKVNAFDHNASFSKKTVIADKGEVVVVLGENPVYIEE